MWYKGGMKLLAQNIKKLRTELGYTQKTFGIALGVPAQTVSAWERGKQMPTSKHLDAIKETLMVDEYALFCMLDVNDTLSRSIDRIYKLPESAQHKIMCVIAEEWEKHNNERSLP